MSWGDPIRPTGPLGSPKPPLKKGTALRLACGLRMGALLSSIASLILTAGRMQRLADQDVAGASLAHRKLLFLVAICVLDFVFVTGIAMWKKWGAYGAFALALFGTLVGFSTPARGATLFVGLVADLVLAVLVSSQWYDFE